MNKLKISAIIPARMGSSRFPGKPLAKILGRTMIEHVVRRTKMCEILDAVYVATCDEEIRKTVESFDGEVVMTANTHERASDRIAEAAQSLDSDIFVMVQGDEPMITPQMIVESVAPMLENESVKCVNLVRRIESEEEYLNRNTIKVVMNLKNEALYFSRSPIPSLDFNATENLPVFKQVCVIPFRRDFLQTFANLAPTPLERAESIDMLRLLEHGESVHLVETFADTHAVDTPEDLRLVENLMKNDLLYQLLHEK